MIDLYETIIMIFVPAHIRHSNRPRKPPIIAECTTKIALLWFNPPRPPVQPPCIPCVYTPLYQPVCTPPCINLCTPRAPPCGTGCADAYISLGHLSAATGSLCLKCTTTSLCTNTLIRTKTKTNTKHKNKKHTLTLIKMIMPESFQQNPSNESHI